MKLNLISKLNFYFTLVIFKITSPFECQSYRSKIFINQFVFIFHALNKFKNITTDFKEIFLKTRFGDFFIRDTSFDLAVVSPSFERLDLFKLTSLISAALKAGKRVVFIDAGAGFGKYSISIGKLLSGYKSRLKIISFEPDPETYKLLRKNVKINKLDFINTHNIALSSKNGLKKFFYYNPARMIVSFKTPEQIIVKSSKLDCLFSKTKVRKGDELFIKVDVEGHEVDVLKGSSRTIKMFDGATLLVEDVFKSNNLNKYLSKNAVFLWKITELNSFWKITS